MKYRCELATSSFQTQNFINFCTTNKGCSLLAMLFSLSLDSPEFSKRPQVTDFILCGLVTQLVSRLVTRMITRLVSRFMDASFDRLFKLCSEEKTTLTTPQPKVSPPVTTRLTTTITVVEELDSEDIDFSLILPCESSFISGIIPQLPLLP